MFDDFLELNIKHLLDKELGKENKYAYLLMLCSRVSFSSLKSTFPWNMLWLRKISFVFLLHFTLLLFSYSTVLQASFLVVIMVLEGAQQTDNFSLSTNVHVIQQRWIVFLCFLTMATLSCLLSSENHFID